MMSASDRSSISSPPHSRRSSVSSLSSTHTDDGPDDGPDDGSMPLPPEGHSSSFKALEQHAQNYARDHGYAVSPVRWKYQYKKRTNCRKYIIGCYCSTKYQDRMKRQRRKQRSTFKTDCPFSFHTLQSKDGSYDLRHRQGDQISHHNHSPTRTPAMHYQHCRL
jgi:hypothetical protein